MNLEKKVRSLLGPAPKGPQEIKKIPHQGKEVGEGEGTSYAYDKNGNLTRVTNAFGELVQELSYNHSGLPITQTDASGNQTTFTYESDGQLKEVRRGNTRETADASGSPAV